jgi:Sigma-70, region 4
VYPLAGASLLPDALRSTLGEERIPARMCRAHGVRAGASLGDLDQGIWERLPAASVDALAQEVVRALRRSWREVEASQKYVSTGPLKLRDVEGKLSRRARNRLLATGMPGWMELRSVRVADLAAIPSLGAQLMLEILTVIEVADNAQPRGGVETEHSLQSGPAPAAMVRPSPTVGRLARRIERARWSAHVLAGDPRLGAYVQRVDSSAASAREAALRVAKQSFTPAQARGLAQSLRELDHEVARLRRLPLLDELHSVVAALVRSAAGQQIVIDRLGLGGEAAMTLQQAGERAGVTRERVRQVVKRFRAAVSKQSPWTPVLDRTIRRLSSDAPAPLSERWEPLVQEGVVDASFSPQTLVATADALGKRIDFVIDPANDLVVPGEIDPDVDSRLASRAGALVSHWGATTIDELRADLSSDGTVVSDALTRLLAQRLDRFCWLDEPNGWFWVRGTARNRLLNQVEKIMTVAGSITISELRDGVGRPHRMQGFRPPREVLTRLCEQTGTYRREGDRIVGGPDLPDWKDVLGINEATLVDALLTYGPLMRRDELEQQVVDERGLNRSSFYVYLTYSPVIERFAPGVYGLRGAQVTAAEVDALIPPHARTQVLQDHGWTDDGDIWVAYRISPASERSGVLGTPGALKPVVQGEFELSAEDGRRVGTVVVEDNMWGLSPFFRRHGIEAGDYVVLRFALRERTATIHAGSNDLLLRFQRGE